jgi:hypothetical protein
MEGAEGEDIAGSLFAGCLQTRQASGVGVDTTRDTIGEEDAQQTHGPGFIDSIITLFT